MPSAGWYTDPSEPSGQRYWDGAAWTEHTAPGAAPPSPPPQEAQWGDVPPASQQPMRSYTVEPDRGSKAPIVAVFVVIALVILVIGGAIALVVMARDDDSDPVEPSTSSFVMPTAVPPSAPSGQGQADDAATRSACETERAAVTTAIAAAKASTEAGSPATPGEFLMDPSQFDSYRWTGTSPDDWALEPIGTPPC